MEKNKGRCIFFLFKLQNRHICATSGNLDRHAVKDSSKISDMTWIKKRHI